MIWLHLVTNALLLWLGYVWLGLNESSVPNLVVSVAVAMVILCLALVVHGAAYAAAGESVALRLRTALRHLAPLLLLALVALAVYGLLAWWKGYSSGPAFQLASWLTLKTRRPVKPERVQWFFDAILFVIRWVVLPWILVPLAGAIANGGLREVRLRAWVRSVFYWIAVPVLLLIAIWVPLQLLGWVPKVTAFGMQVASFVLRALAAYLLFAGGLLALAWVTSGSHPRFKKAEQSAGASSA